MVYDSYHVEVGALGIIAVTWVEDYMIYVFTKPTEVYPVYNNYRMDISDIW